MPITLIRRPNLAFRRRPLRPGLASFAPTKRGRQRSPALGGQSRRLRATDSRPLPVFLPGADMTNLIRLPYHDWVVECA